MQTSHLAKAAMAQVRGKTKTWKLGEYAAGGIIQAYVKPGQFVTVRVIELQTQAMLENKLFRWPLDLFNVEVYLNDLTTSYYASKIVEWMKGVK
jgi:hypothetical protein